VNNIHFIGLLTKASMTDDPEVLAELREVIESREVDFVEYIGETLNLANDLRITCNGIDSEIKRLEALKLEREVRAKSLESLVQWTLEQLGQTEWFNELHTVRLKRNPPKVQVDNEGLVPSEYRKTRIVESESIDKVAIMEALKNGVTVEGCRLVQDIRMEVK